MCQPNDSTWVTASMTCVICGHEWQGVYCRCAQMLECKKCGYDTPAAATQETR